MPPAEKSSQPKQPSSTASGAQIDPNLEANLAVTESAGLALTSFVPIVGIGASAGGLEAFERFFRAVPPESGIAFVIIQHMSPTHSSSLVEIVQKYTDMRVVALDKPTDVEANYVYITPPNRNIAVLHDRLLPMEIAPTKSVNLPIDFFFRELARDQNERSICIILTGSGSDGSAGLKDVHAAGGMVMVQDPASAAYPGMPESAIATSLVDYVLRVEQMPAKLAEYTQHRLGEGAQGVDKNVSTPVELLQQIFILIRAKTGYDFTYYKQNTIGRRVKRRMMIHQLVELQDYVLFLQERPEEVEILFHELLIGVTSFFRDSEAFSVLEEQVIPTLFQHKDTNPIGLDNLDDDQPIRIWIPGCATGEEAYSVAILIQEYLDKQRLSAKVQIFATDIDHRAIEKARIGRYPAGIALDLTPERLSRYFNRDDDNYVITKQIRDMIVFAEQSVIKDPPYSKLDLISCRNLMIYWNSALQKMVLPVFHYALNPSGVLFLGTSETVGEHTTLFEEIDRKSKIFRAKHLSTKTTIPLELQMRSVPTVSPQEHSDKLPHLVNEPRMELRNIVETMLYPSYMPSSVIINSYGEALHFFGRTGKYLEPASGDSSFSVFDMARPGLKPSLATAVRKAQNHDAEVFYGNVQVKTNGDFQNINLKVQPIDDTIAGQSGLLLVIFEDVPESISTASGTVTGTVTDSGEETGRIENRLDITRLESELNDTKEFLQTTIEELETSNEELRSTNEELQSANEELQSTNEELETSKEELQSLNEELVTVNSEHELKIDALSEINNDLTNLLSSTDIATIFLDTELHVKRFTKAASNIIHLIQSDVGRPLAHITSRMADTSLVDEAAEVLRTLIPTETEVVTDGGQWFLMRVTPYRTTDNVIQGVVLTFVDLTEQKVKQAALDEAEKRFRTLVTGIPDTVYALSLPDMRLEFINCNEFLGYRVDELTTPGSIVEAIHPLDKQQVIEHWQNLLADGTESLSEYRVKHKNGSWQWVRSNARIWSKSTDGTPEQLLIVLRLITTPKGDWV